MHVLHHDAASQLPDPVTSDFCECAGPGATPGSLAWLELLLPALIDQGSAAVPA